MGAKARVAPGRVRYRPGGDTQESMERWWVRVARVLAFPGTSPPLARAAGAPDRPGAAAVRTPSR